jgi:hypothetical protein
MVALTRAQLKRPERPAMEWAVIRDPLARWCAVGLAFPLPAAILLSYIGLEGGQGRVHPAGIALLLGPPLIPVLAAPARSWLFRVVTTPVAAAELVYALYGFVLAGWVGIALAVPGLLHVAALFTDRPARSRAVGIAVVAEVALVVLAVALLAPTVGG